MRSTTFKDPHFFYDSLKHLLFLCTKPHHLWRQRPSLIRLLLLQSFVVDVSFVSFFAPPDFLMMLMKTSTEMFSLYSFKDPSRLHIIVPQHVAGFPTKLLHTKCQREKSFIHLVIYTEWIFRRVAVLGLGLSSTLFKYG